MKKRFKTRQLLALLVISLLGFYIYGAQSGDDSPEYPTVQPIAFSHKIHAGENEIPCQYCHAYSSKAAHPGIPSVKSCMGCHNYVLGEDRDYDYNGVKINFKKEIEKLRGTSAVEGYWQRGEPIPWLKFHFVPQHARFKHKPHIRAGMECSECHGDVKEMDLVKPVHKIEMGFCISCHKVKQKSEQEMVKLAAEGKELVYLRDCNTCHY